MKNFFEGFEVGLARAGLHERVERPPAICFLDLSGYTRLTEERGDARRRRSRRPAVAARPEDLRRSTAASRSSGSATA